MKSRYGLPYNGSKSEIADWVVASLPAADCLVDLFCGGGAISNCALATGKFRSVIANDIEPGLAELFKVVLVEGWRPEMRWVSREEFFRLQKEHGKQDLADTICWSFSARRQTYAFSDSKAEYSKVLWEARVNGDLSGFRARGLDLEDASQKTMNKHLDEIRAAFPEMGEYADTSMLRLHPYSSYQAFDSLRVPAEGTRLESSCLSYERVEIPSGAIVYCDPPYDGTTGYLANNETKFDHGKFADWACGQKELVVVSEYEMPSGFVEVASKRKFSRFGFNETVERLFVPENRKDEYLERQKAQDPWSAFME